MATKAKNKPSLSAFKAWALSHSLHHPDTKLPFRPSVKVHEDIADFIHGTVIGLLIGFIVGLILKNLL